MKYYKLFYGFDKDSYISIDSDELHKAQVIAIEGGKAIFKSGFFNNRGNEVLRIVPDWHRVRGWNPTHQMDTLDYADIKNLEEPYRKTLENSKLLADYIIKENRRDLLSIPASVAFKDVRIIGNPITEKLGEGVKELSEKFKL